MGMREEEIKREYKGLQGPGVQCPAWFASTGTSRMGRLTRHPYTHSRTMTLTRVYVHFMYLHYFNFDSVLM